MSSGQQSSGEIRRGCLPDAVKQDAVFLFKACGTLRLTHEIRLAAFLAQESRRKLRLIVRSSTTITAELQSFAAEHGVSIEKRQ